MKHFLRFRIPRSRASAAALLLFVALGDASAQAPVPSEVPLTIRSAERQQLAARRSALMTERDALRSEATRHNEACSAVTEGSAADAACIAAQQRLTARIAAYRGEVERFDAAVAQAPRATIAADPPVLASRRATTLSPAPGTASEAPQLDPDIDVYFASVTGTGDFSVVTPRGERLPAGQAGARRLQAGTRVITGANGTAEITLPDGARVMLGPRTEMVLALDGTPPQSIYDVIAGTLRAVSGRLREGAAHSRWKVRTQHAIAGVRGTDFEATVEPSGAGSWRVHEGSIELRTTEGRVLALLGAGQQLTWDDSLRITSLAPAPAVAPRPAADVRTRLAEPDLASWARENGLLVAVSVLLGLVLIQLFTGRRRAG